MGLACVNEVSLGARNDATRASVEVADTPSVGESIPGKQGRLIELRYDEKTALPVGSDEKISAKGNSREASLVFVEPSSLHSTSRFRGLHEGVPDKAGS
jgi:hypothetical protein